MNATPEEDLPSVWAGFVPEPPDPADTVVYINSSNPPQLPAPPPGVTCQKVAVGEGFAAVLRCDGALIVVNPSTGSQTNEFTHRQRSTSDSECYG